MLRYIRIFSIVLKIACFDITDSRSGLEKASSLFLLHAFSGDVGRYFSGFEMVNSLCY